MLALAFQNCFGKHRLELGVLKLREVDGIFVPQAPCCSMNMLLQEWRRGAPIADCRGDRAESACHSAGALQPACAVGSVANQGELPEADAASCHRQG